MSSMHLAFSSDGPRPLTGLAEGERAVVVDVRPQHGGRADRLLALGVTPGAIVTMLQKFPGIVFTCDQTELAVERDVAAAIVVRPQEQSAGAVSGPQLPLTTETDATDD